jgi:hypothetical protein
VSIFGVLGLLAAAEEGLEVNVLGLTFGLDPSDLALKLPFVGSIRFDLADNYLSSYSWAVVANQ